MDEQNQKKYARTNYDFTKKFDLMIFSKYYYKGLFYNKYKQFVTLKFNNANQFQTKIVIITLANFRRHLSSENESEMLW
jgi:hypothetical protein